jgi:probable rRNA maturation factor
MLNINVINQSKVKISKKFITLCFAEIIELLPRHLQKQVSNKSLNIVFLDQAKAKKINLTFRGKNYATDILSFEPLDIEELGELVICPQVIKRQAKEHQLSESAELVYMLIHGCLHLLGYDHEQSEQEAKRMFRLQDKIFIKILSDSKFTGKRI